MAGRNRVQDEMDDMNVNDLRELVRQQDSQQPSEEERRALRNLHSEIREELITANREEITGDGLQSVLEKIEQNFPRVQTPREAVKDAENIRLLSEIQRQRLQAYDLNLVRFLPGEFVENLKKYAADNLKSQADRIPLTNKSWNMLGAHCQRYFKKSPALHFMCGSFERGEIVKKVVNRERKQRDNDVGKTTELKQLGSFEEASKNEATTKEVEDILATLWRAYEQSDRSPICYFEFVINPFSFGQTVENIFYVSFLARDGYIKIELDADDLPTLEPVEGTPEEVKAEGKARQQVVISITPAEWKEIIEAFKIERPLIRSRQPQTNGTGHDNVAGPSGIR